LGASSDTPGDATGGIAFFVVYVADNLETVCATRGLLTEEVAEQCLRCDTDHQDNCCCEHLISPCLRVCRVSLKTVIGKQANQEVSRMFLINFSKILGLERDLVEPDRVRHMT
jgi:hypothetical protein